MGWVGKCIGSFVAVIDPLAEDVGFLSAMLDKAVSGTDVVFANNQQKAAQSIAYRGAYAVSNGLYKWFNDIDLAKEAPQYRVLSKRVVNFILQHPQPSIIYRPSASDRGIRARQSPTTARRQRFRIQSGFGANCAAL